MVVSQEELLLWSRNERHSNLKVRYAFSKTHQDLQQGVLLRHIKTAIGNTPVNQVIHQGAAGWTTVITGTAARLLRHLA